MSDVFSASADAGTQPGKSESFAQRLADWLFGPRDWSVIDDGTTGFAAHDWYACPTSRVDSGDVVVLDGLRQREAFHEAANLRSAKGAFQCLEIARGNSPKPRRPKATTGDSVGTAEAVNPEKGVMS